MVLKDIKRIQELIEQSLKLVNNLVNELYLNQREDNYNIKIQCPDCGGLLIYSHLLKNFVCKEWHHNIDIHEREYTEDEIRRRCGL